MRAALVAGALYFAVAFAAGFVLGTIRVLALAPALGGLGAVLVELPVMLLIAWTACRRLVARLLVPGTFAARAAMGAAALALLLAAELALGAAAFGRPVAVQMAALATPAGLAGLAGQIAFALVPLVQRFNRPAARR